MEQRLTDQQEIIKKAIEKYLEDNRELVLRRIIGTDGLALTAGTNKNITIDTSGTEKRSTTGWSSVAAPIIR